MRSVRAGAHSLRSSSMSIQALYGIFLVVLFLGTYRINFPCKSSSSHRAQDLSQPVRRQIGCFTLITKICVLDPDFDKLSLL